MNGSASAPEPLGCALFLILAMSIAGLCHSIWLRCRCSRRFATPIDGGKTFRGKRIFGANKMWRGFMVMPVASSFAFAGLAYFRDELPEWLISGIWTMPVPSYAILGFTSGLTFMLAELPNSFLKRQLGIVPGDTAQQLPLAVLCFILDRTDSVIGVLIVLSILVPVPALTWAWALLIGALVHGLFSMLLYLLHVKARPL